MMPIWQPGEEVIENAQITRFARHCARRYRLDLNTPPWRAGQYVTYFLDRDDGLWTAFALRVLGQTKDKAWALCGDFKTGARSIGIDGAVWR